MEKNVILCVANLLPASKTWTLLHTTDYDTSKEAKCSSKTSETHSIAISPEKDQH